MEKEKEKGGKEEKVKLEEVVVKVEKDKEGKKRKK